MAGLWQARLKALTDEGKQLLQAGTSGGVVSITCDEDWETQTGLSKTSGMPVRRRASPAPRRHRALGAAPPAHAALPFYHGDALAASTWNLVDAAMPGAGVACVCRVSPGS